MNNNNIYAKQSMEELLFIAVKNGAYNEARNLAAILGRNLTLCELHYMLEKFREEGWKEHVEAILEIILLQESDTE